MQKFKKTFVFKAKLLFFTIFHIKTNGFFSLFCVFCIFAQGFSVKAQRFDQKSKFLTSFITFLDLKMLKTFVLDTFADENTIKPMYFQFFVGREARGRRGVGKKCNKQ